MDTLYVIDALGYLFRSYYAIKGMSDPTGQSTNALYGFIRCTEKLIKDFSPTHMVAVFDGPDNKRSRTHIYPQYKGHRAKMPDDLYTQLLWAQEYCSYAGVSTLIIEGVEADDTMGSVAKWAEKEGSIVYICSGDKDLCQLVNPHIFLLQTFKNNLIVDTQKVEELYDVRPDQIVDLLAIMGDSSDNIPGISGMGAKTAARLLKEFGSLANLLAHPEKLTNPRHREKLIEEKEQALISQQLASLQFDVPFPREVNFFKRQPPQEQKLTQLYQARHFLSLLKEMNLHPTESHTYTVIKDMPTLHKWMEKWQHVTELCIDTETSEIDPMRAQLVGIGIGSTIEDIAYIPCHGTLDMEEVLQTLRPLLENPRIAYIGHNVKYDLHILKNHGISIQNIGFDTMIASYLLHSESNHHNLDSLSFEHLNIKKIPISDLLGKGKNLLSMLDVPVDRVAEYCTEDVFCTLRLKQVFSEQLVQRNLDSLFREIEIPLILSLFRMEHHGIYLDKTKLVPMSQEFAVSIEKLAEEIYALAGQIFNINSPKQLSHILYVHLGIPQAMRKKSTQFSTAAAVLESMRMFHPIIDKILEYRTLEKLRSTYIDALPKQINPRTQRIHCSFNQSITATGRLSSNNPNLQNIPIRGRYGKRIRAAFQPQQPHWSFISADYSQIELRLLAHLSQDPSLIEAFQKDQDIHQITASKIFQVAPNDVTPTMRHKAKAVNFGIIYGQGSYGLSQELGITVKEAAQFIDTYFHRYPQVQAFIEKCKQQAINRGYSITLMNRQRLLPELQSTNHVLKQAALRISVNAPIQGSQSDLIKLAMVRLDMALQKNNLRAFTILQIHDELILEAPDEECQECKKIIRQIMENIIPLEIPLKVDISIGKNWGEC